MRDHDLSMSASGLVSFNPRPSRRRALGLLAAGFTASALPGCSAPERGTPVSPGETTRATVLGLANERFFPAQGIGPFEQEFLAAMARRQRALGIAEAARASLRMNLLAVSGGGEDGAFGAGLLNGWSAHGSRPVFDVVTGVSTGALTAPFAFLGTAYDAQLKAVYTAIQPKDILEQRGLLKAVFDDAMADNSPLYRMIARYMNTEMLAAIAAGHREGRLLLIASTDLDQQQPVIWNIGAIAASGHPKAMETIHKVLLASAAVPAAFPPVMFDVTVDGEKRQEMHVDGGAMAQVFLYPPALARTRLQRIRQGQQVAKISAYVIRNGRLHAGWASVKRSLFNIAGRAISTMIGVSGVNDVQRIYFNAQRDNIDFNLATIEPDFTEEAPEPFDQGYMRKLYEYGERQGRDGYRWAKEPPQMRELARR